MITTKEDFELSYWKYFLTIEDDFLTIEKTIPIDTQNSNTFSTQYMKILFLICSEIDVLFKEFITYNGWGTFSENEGNLAVYRKILNREHPSFAGETIIFLNKTELKPFANWQTDAKLLWWKDYNSVKHSRTLAVGGLANYKKANQENTVNALAALYQLEMYFYQSILNKTAYPGRLRMPVPQSKRYRIKDWSDNVALMDNRYITYIDDRGNLIQSGHFE